jgi:hypothetical protein
MPRRSACAGYIIFFFVFLFSPYFRVRVSILSAAAAAVAI